MKSTYTDDIMMIRVGGLGRICFSPPHITLNSIQPPRGGLYIGGFRLFPHVLICMFVAFKTEGLHAQVMQLWPRPAMDDDKIFQIYFAPCPLHNLRSRNTSCCGCCTSSGVSGKARHINSASFQNSFYPPCNGA